MKNISFTCSGCRNSCEVQIEYDTEDNVEVKGNGCMRGVLYAQEKVRNAQKEQK